MRLFRTIAIAAWILGNLGCRSTPDRQSSTETGREVHWVTSRFADATDVEAEYIDAFDSTYDLLLGAVHRNHPRIVSIETVSDWLVFNYPPGMGVSQTESRREQIEYPILFAKGAKFVEDLTKTIETEYVFARGVNPNGTEITANYTVLLKLNETGAKSSFVTAQIASKYHGKKWEHQAAQLRE